MKINWTIFNYLKIDPNNQKLLGIQGSSMKEKSKLQESHQEKVRMKKNITPLVVGGYQVISFGQWNKNLARRLHTHAGLERF